MTKGGGAIHTKTHTQNTKAFTADRGLEGGSSLQQDVTLLGLDGELNIGARPSQVGRHGAGGIEALDGAAILGRLALLSCVVEAVQHAIVGGGEDAVQRNVQALCLGMRDDGGARRQCTQSALAWHEGCRCSTGSRGLQG